MLAGMFAVVDWWAVASDRSLVERFAKPLTMVLLIAVALSVEPASPGIRSWFIAALALSLAGDVFLMLDRDLFIPGLAAFLAAHVAYIVGLTQAGSEFSGAAVASVIAAGAIATLGRRIQRSASNTDRRLSIPVGAYIVVISVMLVAAGSTANLLAMAGASLFYISDAVLGWNRFVHPIPRGRLYTMISYHSGQALLVVALLTL